MSYYAIISKAHSVVEYVAETESAAAAIAAFDKEVGLGEGAENWQEWLEVRQISGRLRTAIEEADWSATGSLVDYDELVSTLREADPGDLHPKLLAEIEAGTAPGEQLEAHQSWIKVGDDTETYHVAYSPAEGRCCVLVVTTYHDQRQRASISDPSWCDASSPEEGLLKYLAGDVE